MKSGIILTVYSPLILIDNATEIKRKSRIKERGMWDTEPSQEA